MCESSDSGDRKCGKILYLCYNLKIATDDDNLFDTCIGIVSLVLSPKDK